MTELFRVIALALVISLYMLRDVPNHTLMPWLIVMLLRWLYLTRKNSSWKEVQFQLPHPLTLTDWDSTPINFPDVQRTDIENYFNKCKSYNCLQYINVINKSSSHNCARVSNMISRIPRVKKSFAFSQNRTNHTCMSLQWL